MMGSKCRQVEIMKEGVTAAGIYFTTKKSEMYDSTK